MEWRDVASRIEAGEDGNTEFKRDLAELSGIGRAICPFANAEGGLIVLGVDDRGEIIGVSEDPDAAQERLTSFLHSGCSAPVSARCGRHNHASGMGALDRGSPPAGVRAASPSGARLDQAGPQQRRAVAHRAPGAVQHLRLRSHGRAGHSRGEISTTSTPEPSAPFCAPRASIPRKNPSRPSPTGLRNRRILAEFDGTRRPTLYGLMAFGREPQAHPQTTSFFVQCAAYSGEDRASEVILTSEGKGRLDEQVRRAAGWVRGLGWTERYHGLEREDRPLIPEEGVARGDRQRRRPPRLRDYRDQRSCWRYSGIAST